MNWYYYLHTDGDIIGRKPDAGREQDFRESSFVKFFWSIDTTNRKDAWILVVEALAMGAQINRIRELADKWGLTKEDLLEFIVRHKPTEIQKKGMDMFIKDILLLEPQVFWNALALEGKK